MLSSIRPALPGFALAAGLCLLALTCAPPPPELPSLDSWPQPELPPIPALRVPAWEDQPLGVLCLDLAAELPQFDGATGRVVRSLEAVLRRSFAQLGVATHDEDAACDAMLKVDVLGRSLGGQYWVQHSASTRTCYPGQEVRVDVELRASGREPVEVSRSGGKSVAGRISDCVKSPDFAAVKEVLFPSTWEALADAELFDAVFRVHLGAQTSRQLLRHDDRLSPEVLAAYAHGLSGPRPGVYAERIEDLSLAGDARERLIPFLIHALATQDRCLRCVTALGGMGTSAHEAIPVLLQVSSQDRSVALRDEFHRALTEIAGVDNGRYFSTWKEWWQQEQQKE